MDPALEAVGDLTSYYINGSCFNRPIILGIGVLYWFGIKQNASTAVCLYEKWENRSYTAAPAGCGTLDGAAHLAEGSHMWLVPYNSLPYRCTSHILLGPWQWQLWELIRSATQRVYAQRFLGTTGYYDDLVALYTGALGALFGAVAVAMGLGILGFLEGAFQC